MAHEVANSIPIVERSGQQSCRKPSCAVYSPAGIGLFRPLVAKFENRSGLIDLNHRSPVEDVRRLGLHLLF